MRVEDFLGPVGPLARSIHGYEHRRGQLEMATAVDRTLESGGVLLVEAGTGTGKSLAYLVPALLSGQRVIVSTRTRNLQDQIMLRDLPLIAQHLDRPISVACVKGLNNYVCLRRYQEFRTSEQADAHRRTLPLLEGWLASTTSGDRSDLAELPEDAPIWQHVLSSADTRIGARCEYYDACFATRVRRQAEASQLIVVNHHVFFADLVTRGPHHTGILPDYDAVIFDEGHQIEDAASQFFSTQTSSAQIEGLCRDALRASSRHTRDGDLDRMATYALAMASDFFGHLPNTTTGRQTLERGSMGGPFEQRLHALDNALDAIAQHCARLADNDESLAVIARRANRIRDALGAVAEGSTGTHIAWVETRGRASIVGASPVEIGPMLREELFQTARTVILTSATLSTSKGFTFLKDRLGIDFEVEEMRVESPFDYPRQACLYLPTDLPDPRAADHLDQAAARIAELVAITEGGAFVLCTSIRAMRAFAERLRPRLKVPALLQGDLPKAALLDRFRTLGNAALFATASFWEGVDVPGSALRLVIIDKLPFDVPTDPLIVARCQRIEERGDNAFMGYLVPAAALSLKQGFGRLIRQQSDRGIVAVLDIRLTKKGYGKTLLASLPPASRVGTLEEVRAFWNRQSTTRPAETERTIPPTLQTDGDRSLFAAVNAGE